MRFSVDEISKMGYDCFISTEHNIIISKDGFVSQRPLDNSLKLMASTKIETPNGVIEIDGISLSELVNLLIESHNMQKDINDGVYDNLTPMSKKEVKEYINKIIKNEKLGRNS